MTQAVPHGGKDPKTGQFLQGVSGNPKGRPKGARTKLGEMFLEALRDDWEKHGQSAVERVREEKPDAYLKVVASLMPKDLNVRVNPMEDMDDAELVRRLHDLRDALGPVLGPAPGSGDDRGGTRPETAH